MTTSNLADAQGTNFGDTTRLKAVEVFDSRRTRVAGGRLSRSRRFIVYAQEGAGLVIPHDRAALTQVGVQYGDPHPDDPSCLALDLDVGPIASTGRAAYEVRWTYNQGEFGGFNDPDLALPQDPERPDYQELSLDGSTSFEEFYRNPWPEVLPDGLPQGTPAPWAIPPAAVTDTTVDIGGEPIDINGDPQPIQVTKGSLRIVRNFNQSTFQERFFLEKTGRRNAVPWRGYAAGELLYLRVTATRVAQGVIRSVHEFAFDPFLHNRQRAIGTGEEGFAEPKVATGINPLDPSASHASDVRWYQPFPDFIPFDDLNLIQGAG